MSNRLHPGITLIDALATMSQGHEGASHVLSELLKHGADVQSVLLLDQRGAYGEGIWNLYNQCGQSIPQLKQLLRTPPSS